MINGLNPLNSGIQEKYDEYTNALTELRETISKVQELCEHNQILHSEYVSHGQGYGILPRRICVTCRIEEEGSLWSSQNSWSQRQHNPPVLGDRSDRLIILCKLSDIYDLRLPAPEGKTLWLANEKDKDDER